MGFVFCLFVGFFFQKELKTKCLNEKNALRSLVAAYLTLFHIKKFPEQKKLKKSSRKIQNMHLVRARKHCPLSIISFIGKDFLAIHQVHHCSACSYGEVNNFRDTSVMQRNVLPFMDWFLSAVFLFLFYYLKFEIV